MLISRVVLLCIAVSLASCSSFHMPFARDKQQKVMIVPQGEIKRVALLLPLESSVGEQARTVRDGFLAAYYQTPGGISIDVINAPANKDANIYYGEAQAKGANFV